MEFTEIIKIKPGFLAFKKSFIHSLVPMFEDLLTTYPTKVPIFLCKNQDPDRHWFGSLDPDPDLYPH